MSTEKKTTKAPAKKAPATKAEIAVKEVKPTEKKVVTTEKVGNPMHNMFSGEYSYAVGKRKTAIAQVRIYKEGKNEIIVNGKPYNEYFKVPTAYGMVKSPLKLVDHKNYAITAHIIGGGLNAQADALRHGIARALTELNIEYRAMLKKDQQLTRDARSVERKKYGHRKARRGQQWVKR